jgi:outer membrane lipoprotein SlyB
MTFYEDDALGNWFIKGLQGYVYIVCTTIDYPKFIAVEALDEHYESSKRHVSNKWRPEKRKVNLQLCCEGLSKKWGTMEEGSAAYILMTEVDADARAKYAATIDALMNEVSVVKDQMHSNLQQQLVNMDSAARLEEKSQEALVEAKVFKKQTLKVRRDMQFKNNKMIAIGTAGAAAGGLVLGSLIGGPIGAAVLTPIFAASFLGASGAMKDWGLSQKFVVLKDGGKSSSSQIPD